MKETDTSHPCAAQAENLASTRDIAGRGRRPEAQGAVMERSARCASVAACSPAKVRSESPDGERTQLLRIDECRFESCRDSRVESRSLKAAEAVRARRFLGLNVFAETETVFGRW